MTGARFPERWLNDRRLARLRDDAFRLFVTGLVWSVANPTDGVLSDDDLELLRADPRCADQLAEAGLWVQVADNWLIADFSETQTTREQLQASELARKKARDKKRRQRAAVAAVPGDVPGDSTGQARTGQAPREGSSTRPEVANWLAGSPPGIPALAAPGRQARGGQSGGTRAGDRR